MRIRIGRTTHIIEGDKVLNLLASGLLYAIISLAIAALVAASVIALVMEMIQGIWRSIGGS